MFTKILIANRGEIACRIMRTADAMGIATVAVYSDADAGALHVRRAGEAVRIGGAAAKDSYLRGDAIIAAARATGAQAIHPGYGFLSENADFARACAAAGLVFIGPSAEAIEAMGLKDRAKDIMAAAGVPIVPGYQGEDQSPEILQSHATGVGYPVLIKAVAGGGGKGMRLVEQPEDFVATLDACRREAGNAFGNDRVLIEKYIVQPRHIEMQVFGDSHGNAVHLFERDCSIQRRHQKVVEEAPAPGLSAETRARLGDAAMQAARAIGYTNAGTLEFIMDGATQQFYFMEMNTRLQVEHPVTEAITGLDLVEWQLRVAAGERLPLRQNEIRCGRHAFEARLYAEDPAQNFLPQAGRLLHLSSSPAARLDRGLEPGDAVSTFYDPMIAKIIVDGPDRKTALYNMQVVLETLVVAGLRTNQEFLAAIFSHPAFAAGAVDTSFIARHEKELIADDYGQPRDDDLLLAVVYLLCGPSESPGPWREDGWRLAGEEKRFFSLTRGGGAVEITVTKTASRFDITIGDRSHAIVSWSRTGNMIRLLREDEAIEGAVFEIDDVLNVFCHGRAAMVRRPRRTAGAAADNRIVAPMPGRIVAVLVAPGDTVAKDQPVLVMEAMKMEMTIRAPNAGVIESLHVATGDQVADGLQLAVIGHLA